MKRTLMLGILALAAAANQSFGQGNTIFDNYDSSPYMPILYGHGFGSLQGTGVGSSFHVDLLYYLGTLPQYDYFAMTDAGLNVGINTNLTALGTGGYFAGGIYTVPGYVSGPVSFAVECWDTSGLGGGATYYTANFRGISPIWQESSIAGAGLPADFWTGLPGPNGSPLLQIDLIPEPSILALSSIAAAALFLTRRRFALKAFGKDV